MRTTLAATKGSAGASRCGAGALWGLVRRPGRVSRPRRACGARLEASGGHVARRRTRTSRQHQAAVPGSAAARSAALARSQRVSGSVVRHARRSEVARSQRQARSRPWPVVAPAHGGVPGRRRGSSGSARRARPASGPTRRSRSGYGRRPEVLVKLGDRQPRQPAQLSGRRRLACTAPAEDDHSFDTPNHPGQSSRQRETPRALARRGRPVCAGSRSSSGHPGIVPCTGLGAKSPTGSVAGWRSVQAGRRADDLLFGVVADELQLQAAVVGDGLQAARNPDRTDQARQVRELRWL